MVGIFQPPKGVKSFLTCPFGSTLKRIKLSKYFDESYLLPQRRLIPPFCRTSGDLLPIRRGGANSDLRIGIHIGFIGGCVGRVVVVGQRF